MNIEFLEKDMQVLKDILNVFQLDAKCKEVGLGKEFDIQAIKSGLKCMAEYKNRLTKDQFHTIACEYVPNIATDSGQPEWTSGELDKLWNAITKGHHIIYDNPLYKENEKLKKIVKGLPSEDEIGFILFMTWNKYTYKEAKENWTGRHIKMTTKTVSARLAEPLRKRIRSEK